MNVLFVDHDKGWSGATVSLQMIVARFKLQRIGCSILSSKSLDKIQSSYGVPGISVDDYRYDFLLLYLHFSHKIQCNVAGFQRCLRNIKCFVLGVIYGFLLLRRLKPSMLIINEYVSIHLSIPAFLLRIPVAVYVRSLINTGTFGLRKGLVEMLMQSTVKQVICITSIEKKQFLLKTQLKATVIREFVPVFKRSIANHASVIELSNPSSVVILNLCGISEIKGTRIFIDAIMSLITTSVFTKGTAVIAGPLDQSNPDYAESAMSVISNSRQIRYIHEQMDVEMLFKTATIVVVSNIVTHFSRPMIEAWAACKPVVASDTNHNLLDVVDSVNGCIYKRNESTDLAYTLEKLLKDPVLRMNIAEAGQRTAELRFNNDSNFDLLMKVVKQL